MGLPNTLKLRESDKLTFEVGAHDSLDAVITLAERLLDRLRGIDLHCFEPMPAQDAVPHMCVGPVNEITRVLNESVRLLRSLPRLVGGAGLSLELDYTDTVLELDGEPRLPVEGKPVPMQDTFNEDLDATLKAGAGVQTTPADVTAFAQQVERMVDQLKGALDFVRMARRERSKWALITAGEEGRRKAQKSLRAALILGMRIVKPAQAHRLFPRDPSELETALIVRASLMAFREDIMNLAETGASLSDMDLALHLRDVRIRMLQLFSDRHYSALRAPDRFQLQALFGRLNAWLDVSWENFPEARAVLAELGEFSAGLNEVNNRDILVEHDRSLRDAAVTRLAALDVTLNGTDHWQAYAQALEQLKGMQWRSRELDAMVLGELDRGAGQAAELQGRIGATKAALESMTF